MNFGEAIKISEHWQLFLLMYATIGAFASVLSHRGLSVFHDGLRPLMGSYRNGDVAQKEVANTSFRLGWGFLWGFGIPYSLGNVIPLAYMIFMASDWIGVSVPYVVGSKINLRSLRYMGIAALYGALWGGGAGALVYFVNLGFSKLPINMSDPAQYLALPTTGAYFLFAIMTIAYHYGYRKAGLALLASSLMWFGASTWSLGDSSVWSFVVSVGFLLYYLALETSKRKSKKVTVTHAWAISKSSSNSTEDEIFAENAKRIRKWILPLALFAALTGAAYNLGWMAKDPISALLYQKGLALPAALVLLAWAFAFIPMKFTTAVVTGCMASGSFLDQGVAMLMPNPWAAAVAVAFMRIIEILLLIRIFRFLEKYPTIREVADVMRTAIFHVMEIGFLIGGALAAAKYAGEFGLAIVILAWFINSRKNNPVMPMSLGALSALGIGLFVNLLSVLGFQIA
jgi:hypothetical protein